MINLYNEEIKEAFLREYPKSERSYRRLFAKSANTERALKKDLFDFTENELEDVLYHLNPPTAKTSYVYGKSISSYIRWAIEKQYTLTNINFLLTKTKDYYSKFVDNWSLLFSEKDLRKIEINLKNSQDRVIPRLIFEGVGGNNLSELINLTKYDIDYNENVLKLKNSNGEVRYLKVSDYLIKTIDDAAKQEIYELKNGEPPLYEKIGNIRKLADNDYLLRPVNTNLKEENKPIDKQSIYKRIKLVPNLLGYLKIDSINHFTSKRIQESGMIYHAKQLLDRDGEFENKQIDEIAERFNIKSRYNIRSLCTKETINRLYGDQD